MNKIVINGDTITTSVMKEDETTTFYRVALENNGGDSNLAIQDTKMIDELLHNYKKQRHTLDICGIVSKYSPAKR